MLKAAVQHSETNGMSHLVRTASRPVGWVLSALVCALVSALMVAASAPSAAGHTPPAVADQVADGGETVGAALLSERFVDTSDGSVWTIYTFDVPLDETGTTVAAIEGGINIEGLRLEVSGWPRVHIGNRYQVSLGDQAHPEISAPALLAAGLLSTEGDNDLAPGYTPGPARWPDGSDLKWQANLATFPSGLNPQGIVTALDNGVDAWLSDAGSVSITGEYIGATTVATNDFDGVNAIYWANTTASESYLARTYLWFTDPDANAATPGKAIEFDIKFNNDYAWALGAISGRFDIESVALHEAGHAIGLGHVDVRENSMFPSLVVGTLKRTLGSGDIEGMQALYGTGGTSPQAATPTCRNKTATIVGTGAAETLTGTPGDDVIWAGGGNDIVNGGGGNDLICGGGGKDTISGGAGNDTIYAGGGNDVVKGGAGKDTLIGEAGADVLRGGAKRDVLKGGGGNDKLYGDNGRDKLVGQGGADQLIGGKGNDKLLGGGGADIIRTTNGDTGNAGNGVDSCTAAGSVSSCEKKI